MNTEWCAGELAKFIKLCDEYEDRNDSYPPLSDTRVAQIVEQIHAKEALIIAIIKAANPGRTGIAGIGVAPNRTTIYVHDIRIAANYARSTLLNKAAIEENLATPAPRLSADKLHAWVWEAARPMWNDGHYRSAIQSATAAVNIRVQTLVNRTDVHDVDLMNQAFNQKEPTEKQPRLRYPGARDDKHVQTMRNALQFFAPGVFFGIRNPANHRLDEPTQHEAIEQLAALSLLCRWIEQCDLITSESE